MFGRKISLEEMIHRGQSAEVEVVSGYCMGGHVPSNEDIARELHSMAALMSNSGRISGSLLVMAAGRLAQASAILTQPAYDQQIHGRLERVKVEQIATATVVEHHMYSPERKRVHVITTDQAGEVKSHKTMGEAASAEWMEENNRNGGTRHRPSSGSR